MAKKITYILFSCLFVIAGLIVLSVGLQSRNHTLEDFEEFGRQNVRLGTKLATHILVEIATDSILKADLANDSITEKTESGLPKQDSHDYTDKLQNELESIQNSFLESDRISYEYIIRKDGYIPYQTDYRYQKISAVLSEDKWKKLPQNKQYRRNLWEDNDGNKYFEYSAPVFVRSQYWGEFRIGIPSELVSSHLKKDIYVSALIPILFFIPLAGLIYYVIRKKLNPISEILNATEKISHGDFSARITYRGNDELGKLARSFNRMGTALKKRETDLQRHRNKLEEMVEERTRELSELNKKLEIENQEHEKTSQALEESETKFKAISESAQDAIIVIDDRGKTVYWNQTAENIFGYKKEEIIGKDVHEILAPDEYISAHRKAFPHFAKTGEGAAVGKTLELKAIKKNKQIIPVELSLSAIKLKGKWHATGILRDITEKKKALKDLKYERDLAEKYLEVAGVIMLVLDKDGKVSLINKKGCEVLGYPEDEIVGKNWFENFLKEKDIDWVKQVFRNVMSGKIEGHEYAESDVLTKTGDLKTVAWHNTVIRDSFGNIVMGLSSGEDITERKRIEHALRESEEKLRHMAENAPDVFYRLNLEPELLFDFISPSVTDISSYNVEEFYNDPEFIFRFIHPEDFEKLKNYLTEKKHFGERFLLRWITKDNKTVLMEHTDVPVYKDGEIVAIDGIARDYTERFKAQQELKESEERFKLAASNISDIIYEWDLKTDKLCWYGDMKKNLGYENPEQLDSIEDFMRIVHPDDQENVSNSVDIHRNSLETMQIQYRVRHKNGSWRCWQDNGRVIPDDNGKPGKMIGACTDITERKLAETKLNDQLHFLETLLDTMPSAIFYKDVEGRYLGCNKGFEDMFGTTREDIVGKTVFDLAPQEIAEVYYQKDKELFDNPGTQIYDYKIKDKNGRIRDVIFYKATFNDSHGNIAGMVGKIQDVTEQKEAQKQIKISEEKYRRIFEAFPDIFYRTRLDGTILLLSPSVKAVLGYEADELVGKSVKILYKNIEDRELLLKRLHNRSKLLAYELTLLTKDGKEIDVSINGALEKDSKGNTYIEGTMRDVSEKKELERALMYQADFERTISNLSSGFINIVSNQIDEKINDVLRIIGEFAGVDRSYVFLLRADNETVDNTHEWSASGVTPQMNNLKNLNLKNEMPWFAEKIFNLQDFHVANVDDLPSEAELEKRHFRAQNIKSLLAVPMISNNELRGFIGFDSMASEREWSEEVVSMLKIVGGIFMSSLERKHYEEALRKARDELELRVLERTVELETAKEIAETANLAKSEFLANMSHELRTPMHGILSYARFGMKKIENASREKLFKYFKNINFSGSRLMNLLNDLLDLSKLEAGRMEYNIEENDILNVINQVCAEFDSLINEKNLHLNININAQSSLACFDTARISQVISNLISNAIKFTPEGKTIGVSVDETKITRNGNDIPALMISIADQGVGIPDNEMEVIFDKFIQSSKTKTGAGGTGLGLAISKKIINSHGGDIWAENDPGDGGAILRFTLSKVKLNLIDDISSRVLQETF